jgi:hypothetical protein
MLMMLDLFSAEYQAQWGAIGRAGSKINIIDL